MNNISPIVNELLFTFLNFCALNFEGCIQPASTKNLNVGLFMMAEMYFEVVIKNEECAKVLWGLKTKGLSRILNKSNEQLLLAKMKPYLGNKYSHLIQKTSLINHSSNMSPFLSYCEMFLSTFVCTKLY